MTMVSGFRSESFGTFTGQWVHGGARFSVLFLSARRLRDDRPIDMSGTIPLCVGDTMAAKSDSAGMLNQGNVALITR